MTPGKPNFNWLLTMAWRDSRRNRGRLFLFISSIILGIAALVAIYSFGYNLQKDIDMQAATLTGADLVASTNKTISKGTLGTLKQMGEDRSEERSFASMVYFPKNQGTRLIQVRALQGAYPYYGEIETTPAGVGRTFQKSRSAIVDRTLMLQYNVAVGDSVKIGEVTFLIAGALVKAPGQTGVSSTVAPVVYIPMSYLEDTGLLQKGSRVTYNYYYKYPETANMKVIADNLEKKFERDDVDIETIQSQKEDTARSFADLTQFLSLVGFVALLLGCIGVAGAVHIYMREKLNTVAILRCLGLSARQAFVIYLIQILAIGLLGAILGAIAGTLIQQVLPMVLKDLLPVEISNDISFKAILQGVALGIFISLLFALLPLLSVRKVSPLNTLRMSYEEERPKPDPLRFLVYLLVVGFIYIFSWMQLGEWLEALFFTAGIFIAFLMLSATAMLLMYLVKRFFPYSWGYLARQGLANLYRPNNQTLILIVSIGLGTLLISTLLFMQGMLIDRVSLSASGNQPNMVLFDIQSGQKESVAEMTRKQGLPVLQQVPIVTMRIEEINGINAARAKADSTLGVSQRAFNSEIRSTYRDTLIDSEEISSGTWKGTAGDTIFVSLETDYARRIKVKPGDKITFNVQGALIPTQVGSLRQVDWNRVQTNFRVVFPKGVLEEAPQFHVLITRVPDEQRSAVFQQSVVRAYPNISIIDLGLILSVLDDILDKIGFVIRFMAAFSIITGLVVLISSVLISKYQRIRESVLLRTIGANRRQIFVITALEYFFLGALAAATGILLSLAGSWALARFSFEIPFNPQLVPVLILFLAVSLLTVFIGIINSRSILNAPPLEVLRRNA